MHLLTFGCAHLYALVAVFWTQVVPARQMRPSGPQLTASCSHCRPTKPLRQRQNMPSFAGPQGDSSPRSVVLSFSNRHCPPFSHWRVQISSQDGPRVPSRHVHGLDLAGDPSSVRQVLPLKHGAVLFSPCTSQCCTSSDCDSLRNSRLRCMLSSTSGAYTARTVHNSTIRWSLDLIRNGVGTLSQQIFSISAGVEL